MDYREQQEMQDLIKDMEKRVQMVGYMTVASLVMRDTLRFFGLRFIPGALLAQTSIPALLFVIGFPIFWHYFKKYIS